MEIFQSELPYTPWADPALSRLPGVQPLTGDWLFVDDAYGAQLAYKAQLIAAREDAVIALDPGAREAARELLEMVLAALPAGFARDGAQVICPDGRRVWPDMDQPLHTISQLIQEDVTILQKRGRAHVLTGALLCFPASWTLAEKFMKPLDAIHNPVAEYGAIAGRVERMFDWVRAGQPLWRANALMYHDADLHQPRLENDPRVPPRGVPRFLRSERQTILRLPQSDAVAFVIHTYVVPFERLTAAQQASCPLEREVDIR